MARYSLNSRYCVIGVAFALLAVSVSLVAVHSSSKCLQSIDNGVTWETCDSTLSIFCSQPAIDVSGTFFVFGQSYDVQLTCSWDDGVSVVTSIALIFSLIFLVLMGLTPRIKSFSLSTLILVAGIFAILSLLATQLFMIVNLVKGNQTASDDFSKPGADLEYSQVSYTINALLICLTLITICCATIYGYKAHYQKEDPEQETLLESVN